MTWLRRRFQPEQIRELVLVVLIFALIGLFATQIPNYFTPRTFNRISTSVAVIAVVAMGQTLVVLTRNIDLSVGSMVGVTAYVSGRVIMAYPEMSPLLIVLIAVMLGAFLGAFNGVMVAYGRVPSIIVTLGTLAIYRALLVEFSGAKSVITNLLPQWIIDLSRLNVFTVGELQVRLLVVIAVVVVILAQLVVTYLPFGRRLYAIGSNPEAARIAGFPAQRIVFTTFVISGALSGLAGFMFLARFGNITVVAAQGMELESVAAVVVGGVSTFGGIGTPVGAFLGAVLIDMLQQSLIRWLAISEFWRDALLGLLILLAVATDAVIMSRLRALWARHELQVEPATPVQKEAGHA